MGRGYSATIVCGSGTMRQAITQSLIAQGMEIREATSRQDPLEDDEADIGIAVAGFCGDPADPVCLDGIADIAAKCWIVLSRERHDPIAGALCARGMRVCVLPDDISSDDLGHAAAIAAGGIDVLVGRFARGCTADDMRRINEAGLDPAQLRLLALLADGHANKSIARLDATTEAAVKARIRTMLQKLGLENRTQAAVLAARADLGGCRQEERVG